jgi:CMP-N-acetylneuraminic acid synthetase
MSISINERAANKAFAKVITLRDEVKSLRNDVASRNVGALSIEQLEQVLEGTIIELNTWEYIFNLIEKDE